MSEVSWVFILAMATFAMAVGFILFSLARTRRDKKHHATSAVPREDIAKARQQKGGPTGL